MTDRVARLRQQSVDTRPYISTERAELMTGFYKGDTPARVSTPVCRALAFRHLCERKTICINDGELIVGERGPAPKATPTYPELCCHSLDDLRIMNSRERTRFLVSDDVRRVYEETLIPFWTGRTMREKVFAAMSPQWHEAFEAGVFTEFMEQRSPGHAIQDDKIYRKGILDIIAEIGRVRNALDSSDDPDAASKREELNAMEIVAESIILFARRHAAKARDLAAGEADPVRCAELLRIAEICEWVPARAPCDFQEALQMYWFVHLGVITELNTWDSFNPGRLDQHLMPFYEQGITDGSLTAESARELLECFWIKFNNQPAPPKVGITEAQSGTYTDFCLINLGGMKPDGSDGVNEMTYMLLDVIQEMRLVQPSSCIQVCRKSPDRFIKRAGEIIRTGFGQPSVFNSDVIVRELLHDGKTLYDARTGGPSGCVEVSAFGKESCTLTGYCDWPKILEITLHNGADPRTGKRIGLETGDPTRFASFDQLFEAYRRQLKHFIDIKIAGNNAIERLYATQMPSPFMSIMIDDCVSRAKDYHDGGPRYCPTYIQGVGMGTITDSLSAIKRHVYVERSVSFSDLLAALDSDFADREALRQMLLNKTPFYGNDTEVADAIARMVFEAYYAAVDGRPNTKGGKYRINLLPTTVHVYFGSVTGATPNGRKAGEPLSDGISPSQGADRHGPTGVLRSAAKLDHARTGGTLLNLKFTPRILEGDEGLANLTSLIRSYFQLDGHHVQFNVVTAADLRRAQADPSAHHDLIVRVAGYSDYFVDLGRDLQNEIIARTEHERF